jgi:hypothetical protein
MEERGTGTDVGAFAGVQRDRADFGAVIAGACVTIGAGALLFALGAAIGLSAIDPTAADWNGRAAVVGGGVWSAVAIILGTLAGAYTSVRLAGHYSRADAGAHGLATWGLAFVATLAFTTAVSAVTARSVTLDGAIAAESAIDATAAPVNENPAEPAAPTDLTSPGEATTPNMNAPATESATEAATAAANAGAWASWAFFATALLSAVAGILGGIWALPEPLRALARPGIRGPNRPLDG